MEMIRVARGMLAKNQGAAKVGTKELAVWLCVQAYGSHRNLLV